MKFLTAIIPAIILFFNMPDSYSQDTPVKSYSKKNSADNPLLFSFGAVADVQYADLNPVGDRYYRSSLEKLEEAVKEFRHDSVDFIINMGDLIDRDYESYKPVLNILNNSGIKTYHVTGNHDYSVDAKYLSRLPVFSESREGYYAIIYRKYRLLFLNGNEISIYATSNKLQIKKTEEYLASLSKAGQINAIGWNGGIGSAQLGWMRSQLSEAAENKEKVIILCHFPIAPENIHNLLNYKEVNKLVSEFPNVVVWLGAHNHAGGYIKINNTHFITLKGMVETKKNNSFAVVEVYDNKLVIRGYGRESSYELTF
jgi:predicted phosphodiesterase